MPYKDPDAKRQWELRHRTERLARRNELRRIQAAQPTRSDVDPTGAGVLIVPILGAGALAAYSPKLALGAGGLTLLAATYYRKSWQWWLVGALTVLLALVFMKWEWSQEGKKWND
jgi:hypothetical protein